jgi:DNA-binding NarL/FixJ family response regulator
VIQVLIVDDHPMVRAGVEAYLEAEPGLTVAAAVSTVGEAEAFCEQLRPDVLLSDYHLPDGDGLSLCLRLEAAGGPPTVIFSAFADEGLAVLAAVAGARAVVSKSADPDELISAVEDVARGRRARLTATIGALRTAGRRLDPHDLPVLGMVIHGLEPDDIAMTLGVDGDGLCERRMSMLERLRGGPRMAGSGAMRGP